MLSLLVLAASGVQAHPSGLAFGRASCGSEFHSPENAYVIADSEEAWYLRRIQTCADPFFWTTFETTVPNQDVLTCVITPEIARFQDKLKFKGVIFGADLPPLSKSEIDGLPRGVWNEASLAAGGGLNGRIIEKSNDDYSTCDFVDNYVMRNFADVVTGVDGKDRCMEQLTLDADYKDPVKADATWNSWWLYSKDHVLPTANTYSMVTWLEERGTGKLARGKYEITIAPHVWYKYADAPTTVAAHEQITTCTCGGNGLLYNEQYPERIGMKDSLEVFALEVPYGVCEDADADADADAYVEPCFAAAPKVDVNKVLEWGGQFKLEKGSYTWTLNKEGIGSTKTYHEPQMDIFVTRVPEGSELDAYHAPAEKQIMKPITTEVQNGDDISAKLGTKQTLVNDPDSDSTVFNLVIEEAAIYAIFTQHMPAEFSATFLENTKKDVAARDHYVFPVMARDYVLGDTPSGAALERARAEGASGRVPPGAPALPVPVLSRGSQAAIVLAVVVSLLAGAAVYVVRFKDQSGAAAEHYSTKENPEFDNPLGGQGGGEASNA